MSKYDTRALGINMTGIKSNALSIAYTYYKFPSKETLLNEFEEFLKTI